MALGSNVVIFSSPMTKLRFGRQIRNVGSEALAVMLGWARLGFL